MKGYYQMGEEEDSDDDRVHSAVLTRANYEDTKNYIIWKRDVLCTN